VLDAGRFILGAGNQADTAVAADYDRADKGQRRGGTRLIGGRFNL